jgi:hypothetical protein
MIRSKLSIAIALSASMLASTAFSHPSYKGEAVLSIPKSTHDWSGFYAGASIGGVQNTMNITDNEATAFYATIQQISNPAFTGGLQLGYRHQLDRTRTSGVYGVELSANFSNDKFTKEYGSSFSLYQLSTTNTLKNLCLLQLTGGIAADKTLVFLAAGMSWANLSGSVTSLNSVPFFDSFNVGKKVLGAAFGGGIEYAMTDAFSIRMKVDAIKSGIYSKSNNVDNHYQISNTITQATLGINYKFA